MLAWERLYARDYFWSSHGRLADITKRFENVRHDSKLAVDVWSLRGDGEADEFFGKCAFSISEVLRAPVSPWFEILPGRLRVELSWTPELDAATHAEPVALTLDTVP